MELTEIITWSFGILSGLGVLSAGLGIGYGQFKKGMKGVDDETINSLQRQLTTLKIEMKERDEQFREVVAKSNRMEGQLITYKEIALNKNPEVLKVLQILSEILPKFISNVEYCKNHQLQLSEDVDKNIKKGKSNASQIQVLENA